MSGKTDANLHGRQQCDNELMEMRWQLAFNNELTDEEREDLQERIEGYANRNN